MLKSRGSVHWPLLPQLAVDLCEVDGIGVVKAVLLGVGLLQVVSAHTFVTGEALGERVVEDADVARGDPHVLGKDHRGVQTDDVVTSGDHVSPPLLLDVLLELDTEGAVVPGCSGASVDLATRKDESASFAQVDDVVQGACGGHGRPFFQVLIGIAVRMTAR